MRRSVALPLLLVAVLGGRAVAQSPDSTARRADSLHQAAVRWADSVAQASLRAHDSIARAASGATAASSDHDARGRPRHDRPARWEDSLRFGRRIRVDVAARDGADSLARDEGTFISLTRDSVVYRPDARDSILAVSLRDVRGLWVSGGHTNRAINAVAGALLGAGVSSIIASIRHQRTVRGGSFDVVGSPDYRQAAAVGAGLGFIVGLASGGREDWHRVWPPNSRE